jgi:hypothetical protein
VPGMTHRALRTKVLYQFFLKRTAGLDVQAAIDSLV